MVAYKNVIVTGGAQGIGRATARYLALLGHRVFIIDINETELRHTAETHIPQAHAASVPKSAGNNSDTLHKVGYGHCNLRDIAAVRETIKAAADFFDGKVDVLVNNAGIPRPNWTGGRTMEDPSVMEDWDMYLETNLTAAFAVSQAVIPFMKRKASASHPIDMSSDTGGGCIINISSIHAIQTDPNCEGYAAAKAGLVGLSHAMAISGAQWGIRCNAILPGLIERSHENSRADEERVTWADRVQQDRHAKHPAGRVGAGEDIARTVEWLIGSGFVTGQSVVVDGGVSKLKFAI